MEQSCHDYCHGSHGLSGGLAACSSAKQRQVAPWDKLAADSAAHEASPGFTWVLQHNVAELHVLAMSVWCFHHQPHMLAPFLLTAN